MNIINNVEKQRRYNVKCSLHVTLLICIHNSYRSKNGFNEPPALIWDQTGATQMPINQSYCVPTPVVYQINVWQWRLVTESWPVGGMMKTLAKSRTDKPVTMNRRIREFVTHQWALPRSAQNTRLSQGCHSSIGEAKANINTISFIKTQILHPLLFYKKIDANI